MIDTQFHPMLLSGGEEQAAFAGDAGADCIGMPGQDISKRVRQVEVQPDLFCIGSDLYGQFLRYDILQADILQADMKSRISSQPDPWQVIHFATNGFYGFVAHIDFLID
ncbi:hypothetical protein D3C76_1275310 [compost metagenome]